MYDHKVGNKQFEINKPGCIAQRLGELEKNVGYVNTELKDMKAENKGCLRKSEIYQQRVRRSSKRSLAV